MLVYEPGRDWQLTVTPHAPPFTPDPVLTELDSCEIESTFTGVGMFPFHFKFESSDKTESYDVLGVARALKARRTGKVYGAIDLGTGWDYHNHHEGPLAEWYGVSFLAILSFIESEVLDYFEEFAIECKTYPEKYPSFKVEYGKTIREEVTWSFQINRDTVTLDELNALLKTGGASLRIW